MCLFISLPTLSARFWKGRWTVTKSSDLCPLSAIPVQFVTVERRRGRADFILRHWCLAFKHHSSSAGWAEQVRQGLKDRKTHDWPKKQNFLLFRSLISGSVWNLISQNGSVRTSSNCTFTHTINFCVLRFCLLQLVYFVIKTCCFSFSRCRHVNSKCPAAAGLSRIKPDPDGNVHEQ